LQKPVIALETQVALLLHPLLQIRETNATAAAAAAAAPTAIPTTTAKNPSRTTKVIGNTFDDTEVFFSYSPNYSDLTLEELKQKGSVPFQVQIHYTGLDGGKYLRVISQVKPVTEDRKLAEQDLNLDVVAAQAAQQAALFAQQGDYTESIVTTRANYRWLAGHAKTAKQKATLTNFQRNVEVLDDQLLQMQSAEMKMGLNLSDSDESSDDELAKSKSFFSSSSSSKRKKKAKKMAKKKAARSATRQDAASTPIFALKRRYSYEEPAVPPVAEDSSTNTVLSAPNRSAGGGPPPSNLQTGPDGETCTIC
jgi:hypothetical protein